MPVQSHTLQLASHTTYVCHLDSATLQHASTYRYIVYTTLQYKAIAQVYIVCMLVQHGKVYMETDTSHHACVWVGMCGCVQVVECGCVQVGECGCVQVGECGCMQVGE